MLEMCGIAIAPGNLGPRECAVGVTVRPNGAMEPLEDVRGEDTHGARQGELPVALEGPRGRGGYAGGQAGECVEAEAACGGVAEGGGTVFSAYLWRSPTRLLEGRVTNSSSKGSSPRPPPGIDRLYLPMGRDLSISPTLQPY